MRRQLIAHSSRSSRLSPRGKARDGLATIYGIVTQAGGRVHVYSEPDHGTAVSVLLPAADDALKSEPRPSQQVRHPGGDETILLVEDEQALREVTTRMLERNGYHVLSAADGKQAMTLATTHVGRIELLLTDVIMPGALGREVAAKMVALRPAIRVCISGYAHSVLGAQGTSLTQASSYSKSRSPSRLC